MATLVELQRKIDEHLEMSKQLDEVYTSVWGDMVVYIRTSSLTGDDAEELVGRITVTMLEAQARGESVSSAFDNDYQKFCDDLIATKSKGVVRAELLSTWEMALGCFNVSLFFAWFNTLENKGRFTMDTLTTVNVSVALILTMVIIMMTAMLILKWLHTKIYDYNYNTMPVWRKALPGILISVVVLAVLVAIRSSLNHLVLFRVHIGWMALLMAGVWVYGKYVAGRKKA